MAQVGLSQQVISQTSGSVCSHVARLGAGGGGSRMVLRKTLLRVAVAHPEVLRELHGEVMPNQSLNRLKPRHAAAGRLASTLSVRSLVAHRVETGQGPRMTGFAARFECADATSGWQSPAQADRCISVSGLRPPSDTWFAGARAELAALRSASGQAARSQLSKFASLTPCNLHLAPRHPKSARPASRPGGPLGTAIGACDDAETQTNQCRLPASNKEIFPLSVKGSSAK